MTSPGLNFKTTTSNAVKVHRPAAIVGCVAAVALVLFLCVCCCIKRKEKARRQRLSSRKSTITKPSVSDASYIRSLSSRSERRFSSTGSDILLIPEGKFTPKITVRKVQPERSISSGSGESDVVVLSKDIEEDQDSDFLSELGKLRVALWYDKNCGMLTVTIIAADDVQVRDKSGYSYATVELTLSPFDDNMEVEKRTHEVRAARYLKFGETFTYELQPGELDQQILTCYLYERNPWTTKEGLGQTSLPLTKLNLSSGREYVQTRALEPFDPRPVMPAHRGSVYLEIDHDQGAKDGKTELSVYVGDLKVIKKDPMSHEKYFASISVYGYGGTLLEKKSTATASLHQHEDFSLSALFILANGLNGISSITVKLKEVRKMRRNHLIGGVNIKRGSAQWDELEDLGSTRGWFPLYKKK